MHFKISWQNWFWVVLFCFSGWGVVRAEYFGQAGGASLNSSVSDMRCCILSLWEVFDLLQACRIAPEARADFELECPSLIYSLLDRLGVMVASSDAEEILGDVCVLRRYFVAMHASFTAACRDEYVGVEKQLRYLLESLDRLFLALFERYGLQNEVEIAIPTRLLACAAALHPSA
ncbi:MAG: hypothetical protein UV79_C0011G0012 [candidate division TM6 bacterium GW2011_GWF2_43_17]|nr:MAG: hypothetical protein UV79_C0011G0012 [candidate division TM6 bacterium GW2011_GWF2_43_17]